MTATGLLDKRNQLLLMWDDKVRDMRQVRLEDLCKEKEGVSFTYELLPRNALAVHGMDGEIDSFGDLIIYTPRGSKRGTIERIELVLQDFQTNAEIWVWLLAEKGNSIKGKLSGDVYSVVDNKVMVKGMQVMCQEIGFHRPENYSKVVGWESKLSKDRSLLCWVGDTSEIVREKQIIAEIVSNSHRGFITTTDISWGFAEALDSAEILAFLATYKEVVCD